MKTAAILRTVASDPCPKCGSAVPISSRECPVCSRQLGFPNVRMAERVSETSALKQRLAAAEASVEALGAKDHFLAFLRATSKSQAVMNRSLGALSGWLTAPNPLFASYFRQVEAGRQPDGSEWDEQRGAAEATINPYCYKELNYAALTLDGGGITYYGPYSVMLKEVTIEDRASVFEENPFIFNQRHHVVSGTSPPLGFRAPWSDRSAVAGAKLFQKINAATEDIAFPEILMDSRRSEPQCDFVEVHIYGPVNRAGIETVRGPKPMRRPDQAIWQQAVRILKNAQTKVEEVT